MKHGPGTYNIAEVIYFSQLLKRQALLEILRIEGLSDDLIPGLEIPTGTPLVYELDKDQRALNIFSPSANCKLAFSQIQRNREFVLPQFGLQCDFLVFWFVTTFWPRGPFIISFRLSRSWHDLGKTLKRGHAPYSSKAREFLKENYHLIYLHFLIQYLFHIHPPSHWEDLKPLPTSMAVEPLKFGRYLGDAATWTAIDEILFVSGWG